MTPPHPLPTPVHLPISTGMEAVVEVEKGESGTPRTVEAVENTVRVQAFRHPYKPRGRIPSTVRSTQPYAAGG